MALINNLNHVTIWTAYCNIITLTTQCIYVFNVILTL
jgi:hypothetical protein